MCGEFIYIADIRLADAVSVRSRLRQGEEAEVLGRLSGKRQTGRLGCQVTDMRKHHGDDHEYTKKSIRCEASMYPF